MRLTIEGPDLSKMMEKEIENFERANSMAMEEVAREIKEVWRDQIRTAGLGNRLANSVRSRKYPEEQHSSNPAAFVWTNADDILSAFERGVTITAQDGFYLAIPLPAAGKGANGARITPEEWERRRGMKLRYVYRKGRPALLVADGRLNKKLQAVQSRSKTGRNRATVPVFVLLRRTRLTKRLDLMEAADQIAATFGDKVERWWR